MCQGERHTTLPPFICSRSGAQGLALARGLLSNFHDPSLRRHPKHEDVEAWHPGIPHWAAQPVVSLTSPRTLQV